MITEAIALCGALSIPIFFSACVKNEPKQSVYIADGLSPEVLGVGLAGDFFPDMLNVLLGFDTVPSPEKDKDFIISGGGSENFFENEGEEE